MQSSMGGNKDRMKGRYNKVQVLDKIKFPGLKSDPYTCNAMTNFMHT